MDKDIKGLSVLGCASPSHPYLEAIFSKDHICTVSEGLDKFQTAVLNINVACQSLPAVNAMILEILANKPALPEGYVLVESAALAELESEMSQVGYDGKDPSDIKSVQLDEVESALDDMEGDIDDMKSSLCDAQSALDAVRQWSSLEALQAHIQGRTYVDPEEYRGETTEREDTHLDDLVSEFRNPD